MLQKGAKESKLLIYLSQNNERTCISNTVQVFHHVIQTRETDESASPFTSRMLLFLSSVWRNAKQEFLKWLFNRPN